MKNKRLFLAVLGLAALAAVVLVEKRPWIPKVSTVVSDDGRAKLVIPEGALPDGVALSDISVARLDPAGFAAPDGTIPAAVYDFRPDGLQFKMPVRLSMTAARGDRLPTLALLEPNADETFEETFTTVDVTAGTVTVAADIRHFTRYALVERIFHFVYGDDFGKVKVGEGFTVPFEVLWKTDTDYEFVFPGSGVVEKHTRTVVGEPTISGIWMLGQGDIDPTSSGQPDGEKLRGGTYRHEEPFTCKGAGPVHLQTQLSLHYGFDWKVRVPGRPDAPPKRHFMIENLTFDAYGACVAGEVHEVEMLQIGGSYYPKSQFTLASPDACNAPHYHAHSTVYGLRTRTGTEVVTATDPNGGGCGFGRVQDVPVVRLELTPAQQAALAGQMAGESDQKSGTSGDGKIKLDFRIR